MINNIWKPRLVTVYCKSCNDTYELSKFESEIMTLSSLSCRNCGGSINIKLPSDIVPFDPESLVKRFTYEDMINFANWTNRYDNTIHFGKNDLDEWLNERNK